MRMARSWSNLKYRHAGFPTRVIGTYPTVRIVGLSRPSHGRDALDTRGALLHSLVAKAAQHARIGCRSGQLLMHDARVSHRPKDA